MFLRWEENAVAQHTGGQAPDEPGSQRADSKLEILPPRPWLTRGHRQTKSRIKLPWLCGKVNVKTLPIGEEVQVPCRP